MRGGLERWKRGVGSQGVRQALGYAFRGTCDSHLRAVGADALAAYSDVDNATVTRFAVENGQIACDQLSAEQLALWVDGCDPESGERRGQMLSAPTADLVLDSTLNAPKSFSIAALIHPGLAREYEALQDRLRDRILLLWQTELNARRGAGGRVREMLTRVEVVELQHRRSRALDPHIHRHLWLSVKVQGRDGKWSNVDSRVAMRMQNLVNAEGELAARTDPEWLAALAAHGYTLNAEGEIAELAHVVRPLSRRSNQIEANRAVLLAQWSAEHPGQTPGRDVLQRIDRYAWATHRPDRPQNVDEDEWEGLVRDELCRLDPAIFDPRPATLEGIRRVRVDRDHLARCAVADADGRSKASCGRFSILDVRAGAVRALAASGVAADRGELQRLVDDVTARALAHTRDLIPEDRCKPPHVKVFVTRAFAVRKKDLGDRLTRLSNRPLPAGDPAAARTLAQELANARGLGGSQADAVAAVAGVEPLVTVTGPAGTGKTTLLRVARDALSLQGRRLVVVAPTRKAAAVAGREVEVPATSIHALLADHGWRWRKDDAGGDVWWRLRPGDADPMTGAVYSGPGRMPVDASTRIVVDEAGMLDLDAADALTRLAGETGAGLALIGDPLQASPVGHAGAMALATRRAGVAVTLAEVHRFHDPRYADLTLRLRSPQSMDDAVGIAAELQKGGHIRVVGDLHAARTVLVDGYFRHQRRSRTVAIITATNDDAAQINEAIQDARVERGQLALERIAVGMNEQRLLEGDVVQTRRNDHTTGVENRALWTIARIGPAAIELQRLDDTADRRVVSHDYTAEHVQLAYATTVHGIQGETTDAALVGPGVNAAGLYVGLTRGRRINEAVVIAGSASSARQRLAEEMMRGQPEIELDDTIRGAKNDLTRAARDPGADARELLADRVIRELAAWFHAARIALLRSDAAEADSDARRHARPRREDIQAGLPPTVRQMLADRIDAAEVAEREAFARYVEELAAEQRPYRPESSPPVSSTHTPTGRGI